LEPRRIVGSRRQQTQGGNFSPRHKNSFKNCPKAPLKIVLLLSLCGLRSRVTRLNFRLSGACLLWVFILKFAIVAQTFGLLFSKAKFMYQFWQKRVGFSHTHLVPLGP
jgi:hypothetical protein